MEQLPGERVDGDGALPGLKARANPARSSAVEGKGCGRHTSSARRGTYRVGLALPLEGRDRAHAVRPYGRLLARGTYMGGGLGSRRMTCYNSLTCDIWRTYYEHPS